jgi:hypothetical protein
MFALPGRAERLPGPAHGMPGVGRCLDLGFTFVARRLRLAVRPSQPGSLAP